MDMPESKSVLYGHDKQVSDNRGECCWGLQAGNVRL